MKYFLPTLIALSSVAGIAWSQERMPAPVGAATTDTRQLLEAAKQLTQGQHPPQGQPAAPKATRLRVTDKLETLHDPRAEPIVVRSDTTRLQREMIERGWYFMKMGDTQNASKLFGYVARRHPDTVEAHVGLGAAALAEGDIDTAMRHFRDALDLAPGHPVVQPVMIGLRAATSGEAGEGIAALQERIQADPGNDLLHFVLGNLQARRGRWEEAAEAYRNALLLAPDNRSYAYNLAVAEDRRARPAAAIVYYRRALREGTGAPLMFDAKLARARLEALLSVADPTTPERSGR